MNKLIAVWGKNGSGKSTVAANLACAFAKRGYKTALVGANRFYGSIQYMFNLEVRAEQSLRSILAGGDSLSIQGRFTECASVKNLYIASLADSDDCAGYRKLRTDMIVRFINLVKKSYPVTIIDCDESTEDPLSMYCLTLSESVVYVTRPLTLSAVFSKAYEPIVAGLQIGDRMKVVFNDNRAAGDAAAYIPFKHTKAYTVLPFCKSIERTQGTGSLPAMMQNGVNRDLSRYRKGIQGLADALLPSGVKGAE